MQTISFSIFQTLAAAHTPLLFLSPSPSPRLPSQTLQPSIFPLARLCLFLFVCADIVMCLKWISGYLSRYLLPFSSSSRFLWSLFVGLHVFLGVMVCVLSFFLFCICEPVFVFAMFWSLMNIFL